MSHAPARGRLAFVCEARDVKRIKSLAESEHLRDAAVPVIRVPRESTLGSARDGRVAVQLCAARPMERFVVVLKEGVADVAGAGMEHCTLHLTAPPTRNPLRSALCAWAAGQTRACGEAMLAPPRYSIHGSLLIVAADAFRSPEWAGVTRESMAQLLAAIAQCAGVTHIARSAPIPNADNCMRQPTQLEQLFGDFGIGPSGDGGPVCCPATSAHAYWTAFAEMGVWQVYAPLFTMASRGNITEKARVQRLDTVQGTVVADLYCGIGYFVFPYVRAGARRVFGWDLNAWSLEGLRRGAEMNGMSVRVCGCGDEDDEGADALESDTQIVAFAEDNQHAAKRLAQLRDGVQHVNLGLIPSSEASWACACTILDTRGGWIHVHATGLDTRESLHALGEQVAARFTHLLAECKGGAWSTVASTHYVKSYGPRTAHVVYDVECRPRDADEARPSRSGNA